jgi:hypothetical protein
VPENLDGDDARSIAESPLYRREDVLSVLRDFKPSVMLWTDDCNDDVHFKLGWTDHGKVVRLIKDAVNGGRRLGSEWCEQKPDGPCAPCDAYEVVREKQKPKKMYVKFAIAQSGMQVLLISCHKSEPKKKAKQTTPKAATK